MDAQAEVEMVTKSDILGLTMATWDRPRSTEQLLGFIARREAEIADKIEDEFD
ncbi:MAG TPA: hypothetical protein VMR16_00265 [Candidatus Saccharimonadales bacterium]|nr:hypothetical protein [Candidatus Saccharimonadales bacterium]